MNNESSVLFCNSLWIAVMEIILKGHLVLPLTSKHHIFEILFLKDFHNCNVLKILGTPFSVEQCFPFYFCMLCFQQQQQPQKIASCHNLWNNPSLNTINKWPFKQLFSVLNNINLFNTSWNSYFLTFPSFLFLYPELSSSFLSSRVWI